MDNYNGLNLCVPGECVLCHDGNMVGILLYERGEEYDYMARYTLYCPHCGGKVELTMEYETLEDQQQSNPDEGFKELYSSVSALVDKSKA